MKYIVSIIIIFVSLISCRSTKVTKPYTDTPSVIQDTVKIANDSLEYSIIVIDPGFNSWLLTSAKPEGFYSQNYLETKNILYVLEWNQRVNQPHRFPRELYEMHIDYNSNVDYGYDVNYKLYNYFIYFQLTYNQKLGNFSPRL